MVLEASEPRTERLAALILALGGPNEERLEQAVGLFPGWDWERAARWGQIEEEVAATLEAIARGRGEWASRWRECADTSGLNIDA